MIGSPEAGNSEVGSSEAENGSSVIGSSEARALKLEF